MCVCVCDTIGDLCKKAWADLCPNWLELMVGLPLRKPSMLVIQGKCAVCTGKVSILRIKGVYVGNLPFQA